MLTIGSGILIYNQYCSMIEEFIKKYPVGYWKERIEQQKRQVVRGEHVYSHSAIFLGHYNPLPDAEVTRASDYRGWVRPCRDIFHLPLYSSGGIGSVYGFDRQNRMIYSKDVFSNEYSFVYKDNKVLIVKMAQSGGWTLSGAEDPEDIDIDIANAMNSLNPDDLIRSIAECTYDKRGRIVSYMETFFEKGRIRDFQFVTYTYSDQGIKEKQSFFVSVHLRCKSPIIPHELVPDVSENSFYEIEKALLKAGYNVWGPVHYGFIHDEQGKVVQYIEDTGSFCFVKKVRKEKQIKI